MRAALPLLFALFVPLAGCGTPSPQSPAGAAKAQELSWIRDDAPRAVAEAKASGKPLFVEFGAEWCKACVSMGNYAFKDPALVDALRDRAVWLSIDIENPANAAFVAAHRYKHYPTFTVLAGSTEQSWTGYFQADEFVSIFRVALLGDAGAIEQQELRYAEKYRPCADAATKPAADPWVDLAVTTTAAMCVQALLWKGLSTPDSAEVRKHLQAALVQVQRRRSRTDRCSSMKPTRPCSSRAMAKCAGRSELRGASTPNVCRSSPARMPIGSPVRRAWRRSSLKNTRK